MERVRGSAERVQKWGNRRGLIWFQWNVCWQCSVAWGLGINDWTLRLSKPEDFCGLVFLCALFRWREGSSQLIDTELSMKRTKRSPLLPWLASPPKRGGFQPVKGYSMKHTHTNTLAHANTHTCGHIKMKSDICKYTSVDTSAKKKKGKKMKINIWADGPLFNYTRSVIQHSHSHTEASAHEHICRGKEAQGAGGYAQSTQANSIDFSCDKLLHEKVILQD